MGHWPAEGTKLVGRECREWTCFGHQQDHRSGMLGLGLIIHVCNVCLRKLDAYLPTTI